MKQDRTRVSRILWVCLIFSIAALFISVFNRILEPVLGSVAELHVKTMIHRSVNEAVAESFSDGSLDLQLMQVKTAGNGHVTMIQADMAAVNEVVSVLTGRIQSKIGGLREERISVPWGNVLGSQILTQMGPNMKMRICFLRKCWICLLLRGLKDSGSLVSLNHIAFILSLPLISKT